MWLYGSATVTLLLAVVEPIRAIPACFASAWAGGRAASQLYSSAQPKARAVPESLWAVAQAYENVVQLSSGGSKTLSRRERPHVVLASLAPSRCRFSFPTPPLALHCTRLTHANRTQRAPAALLAIEVFAELSLAKAQVASLFVVFCARLPRGKSRLRPCVRDARVAGQGRRADCAHEWRDGSLAVHAAEGARPPTVHQGAHPRPVHPAHADEHSRPSLPHPTSPI